MTKRILLLLATISSVAYSANAAMTFTSYDTTNKKLKVTSNQMYIGTRNAVTVLTNVWPYQNPNSASAQTLASYTFTFSTTAPDPLKFKAIDSGQYFGMALDGVLIDPVTDECWKSTTTGVSGQRVNDAPTEYNYVYRRISASQCNYRFDGIFYANGAETRLLGIDNYGGHARPGGIYHYHMNPLTPNGATYNFDTAITDKINVRSAKIGSTDYTNVKLVGFSGGAKSNTNTNTKSYPILYHSGITSSYSLKTARTAVNSETAPLVSATMPLGIFSSDYEFKTGGILDKANGAAGTFVITVNDVDVTFPYAFFATGSFPYFPRMLPK